MNPFAKSNSSDVRSSFTFRELEVLSVLIDAGKTTVAAQILGLSQPAISRSLAHLEKELGRQLFERAGGRLVPTREAFAINEELGPIFAALARIGDRSGPKSASHSGSLRIAAPPTIAHRFLPSRIARFTKHNPDVEVVFDVISSDVLVSSIADGRFDLGLSSMIPSHPGVRAELLLATEAICALPGRHKLVDRKVIQPEDLEGEPFVASMRRHSERIAVDRIFEKAGVRRRMVIETATAVSAAEFVREGLGIAILNPFPIAHQLGSGIVVRPFSPAIPFRTSFLLPSSRPPSPVVAAFMEMTRTSLE